ncbi:uncharacterized protein LOC143284615 [Babylonia areolata]|uniref:uncharacterized protein LOC143284615 n=1 Tax=Babylonia areolata TaxID=304850 RepID=UPI003FD3097A
MESRVDELVEEQIEDMIFSENEEIRKFPAETKKPEDNVPEVTAWLLQDVCKTLKEDPCLPSDFKNTVCSLQCDELLPKLSFLTSCLVPRSKFLNAAKERAWGNYHCAFLKNMESLTETTKSSQVSAWIALRIFQRLVSDCYCNRKSDCEPDTFIPEEEKTVIRYVAGSVIKKIKQKLWRLQKNHHIDEQIECLNNLTLHSGEEEGCSQSATDMTKLLDRGGLTYVKPNISEMFCTVEVVFRQLAGTGNDVKEVSVNSFVAACLESTDVTERYYDTLYQCGQSLSTKIAGDVLIHILDLFFRIRIHHKMKIMMDKVRYELNLKKKQKGLRKTLKTSSGSDSL